MADKVQFKLGEFRHAGATIEVIIEESTRLRRISFVRLKKVMGVPRKVGEVHIYPDLVDDVSELLQKGKVVLEAIAQEGISSVTSKVQSGTFDGVEIWQND